ncbi:unnamed protein product [Brachionus calyciflorus]|uniref:G-protein coupled receptors family 1 profile domain-containing protein n=1 Tax=Brachionus calyciflorus TaxID=104777 RepID=A0A814BUE7_9BILA|nr:unnamed protein product [Brachionus calyciflorus]
MNNKTNQTQGTNITISTVNALQTAIISFINNIGYFYITTPICVIGILLNIVSIIVFVRLGKNGNIYKYFMVKTIAESIILLIGSLIPFGTCVNCAVFQTLPQAIYRLLGTGSFNQIASTYSGFSEIAITIDRILILKNKELKVFNYKLVMPIMFILSFSMFIPMFFANYIRNVGSRFIFTSTDFGSSPSYPLYLASVVLSRNLFFFVSLSTGNILLLIEFRKYLNKKYKLVNAFSKSNAPRIKTESSKDNNSNLSNNKGSNETNGTGQRKTKDDPEKKLTKMALTLSLIFIVSRCLQSVGSISTSIDRSMNVRFNPFTTIYTFFTNVLTYVIYSMSFLAHYYFNNSFAEELKNFFKKST